MGKTVALILVFLLEQKMGYANNLSVLDSFLRRIQTVGRRLDDCDLSRILQPPQPASCEQLKQHDPTDLRLLARDWVEKCGAHSQNARIIRRRNVDCTAENFIHITSEESRDYWTACKTKRACEPAENELHMAYERLALQRRQLECNDVQPMVSRISEIKTQQGSMHLPDCIAVQKEANISQVVLHHSALPVNFGPRELQGLHMFRNRWSDIGYHYVIAPNRQGEWVIYEGRPRTQIGAHVGPGTNSESLGILVVGNWSDAPPSVDNPIPRTGPTPPFGAIQRVNELVLHLKREIPSIRSVAGHNGARISRLGCGNNCRHECTTLCPGDGCQNLVPALQRRIDTRRD